MEQRFKTIECMATDNFEKSINFLCPVDTNADINEQIIHKAKILLNTPDSENLKIKVLLGLEKKWGHIADLKL